MENFKEINFGLELLTCINKLRESQMKGSEDELLDLCKEPRNPYRAKVHTLDKCKISELKRGDFIINRSEIGYRNEGKYIFDGNKIINLSDEPDDYGSIPKQFQIGEFPPRYWFNRIDHNNFVPFNAQKLGKLTPDMVYYKPQSQEHGNLYLPFEISGRKLAIIDNKETKMNDIKDNIEDFLEEISKSKYFEFYDSQVDISYFPPGFDEETVLLLSGYL